MRYVALLTLAFAFAFSQVAATDVPAGEFQSVELRNGGRVVIRHGAVQRVTIAEGDERYTRVRLADGKRLIVDRTGDCPRGHRVSVEITTPHLAAARVSNGGSIVVSGAFPAQTSIEASVDQGGTVDVRSIRADDVEATVYSGGRIFATAERTLEASVESGGAITYWGGARVRRSVRDGGVVQQATNP
jgi:Putative auto-transporter adhesin, head GIN domain